MAINTTWSVSNMTHNDSDGGVILVYWSCVAASDGDTVLHRYRRRQATSNARFFKLRLHCVC